MIKNKIGVHRTHCCLLHGCKYRDENCPVELGEIDQDYICEDCDGYGIQSVAEVKALKKLGIRRCGECGNYYTPKQ